MGSPKTSRHRVRSTKPTLVRWTNFIQTGANISTVHNINGGTRAFISRYSSRENDSPERRLRQPRIRLLSNRPTSGRFRNSPSLDHACRLILLPIEVPGSRVHRDDELRAYRRSAFQEAIVGLVPNDAQIGQRIADVKTFDNLSDEFRMVAQYVRVFLEDRRTDPRLNQGGVCEFKDESGRVVLPRKRSELQNAGVKNDSQGMAWRVAVPARVAWLRRTQPPRVRSSSCRGSGGVLSPAPWRA
jgi:hypothetical protein